MMLASLLFGELMPALTRVVRCRGEDPYFWLCRKCGFQKFADGVVEARLAAVEHVRMHWFTQRKPAEVIVRRGARHEFSVLKS